jgi:hypothetical protein
MAAASCRGLALCLCLLFLPSPAHADGPSGARISRLNARGDAIYDKQMSAAATRRAIGFYRQALKLNHRSFEALWRTARAFARLADRTRIRTGNGGAAAKQGYDHAFRAVRAHPKRVEGHYWAAICIGEYGLDMSIWAAIRKGIRDKFLRFLRASLRIDPSYDDGGPYRVLGIYHHRLPWPMKSRSKALRFLRKSLTYSPRYGITHAVLAQVLTEEGRSTAARRHVKACLRARPGGQHPQMVRRYQRKCAAMK